MSRRRIKYPYDGQTVVQCRGCGAPVFWYEQPGSGARSPIPVDPETREAHWATCPMADQFRGTGRESNKRRLAEEAARQDQEDLFK